MEKSAASAACDVKKSAIEGFDKECAAAEGVKDDIVQEVCKTYLDKMLGLVICCVNLGIRQSAFLGANDCGKLNCKSSQLEIYSQ